MMTEETIDLWQRETDLVTPEIFKDYYADGDTRGFRTLENLETAFAKMFREVKETQVGDVPAVWSVYNMGYVVKTREADAYIQNGASPRATLALNLAARGNALLHGRAYATPQDVKEVVHDVLRHRILLTYEAEAEGITADGLIDKILNEVPVP